MADRVSHRDPTEVEAARASGIAMAILAATLAAVETVDHEPADRRKLAEDLYFAIGTKVISALDADAYMTMGPRP